MPDPTVCVSIVTYNSERYIRKCLDALLGQDYPHLDVVVVDNASADGTRDILYHYRSRVRIIYNHENVGFAAAQNQAIATSTASWALVLNPDVLLEAGFVRALIEAARSDPHVGAVCGKLLSIGPGFVPLPEPRLDSTGMYFTPAMRHFDRGSRTADDGRFDRPEYVFGASAAAALYSRQMIENISIHGQFFDANFFAYREDADVAWRAQLLGWRTIYTPSAIGYHVRTVSPDNRGSVSAVINMHSVKNRFLLRIKNLTPGLWRKYWLPMTVRDLLVIGGCIVYEPRSLAAFWRLARCLADAKQQRDWIMSRRRISDEALAQWFCSQSVSMPLTPFAAATCSSDVRGRAPRPETDRYTVARAAPLLGHGKSPAGQEQ